ncbi:MAG: Lrp/AsnC family transcriptional regulator [Acidilobus sp.]|nr:Lrp/AsnC family transcriptional regulator [Acidilobus sp.]NAZ32654.1 Lrp/AsnC family transcriptional regulator [Acidilobus sp.]
MNGLAAEEGTDELEKKAMELLRQSKDGVLQSDLWKSLKISSREGSRLVLRLMRKGLIRREEVTVGGRKTYKLYPVGAAAARFTVQVSVASILDIPCATCPHLLECGAGGFYDPSTCTLLELWLRREAARLRQAQQAQQAQQAG